MTQKPVLVVMAAGMGSRYGGLKQIDPVGSRGEAILDYSLFDAHAAGFEKAVIIIKQAIAADFMETVGQRLKRCPMEIVYAYQELEKALPEGYPIPQGRTKPWGTGHAVLCAREEIGNAPFAVINSDDYYGKSAYRAIYQFLCQNPDSRCYAMVGYRLGNTVTDSGSVARGICRTDEAGMLVEIHERLRIEKYPGGIHYLDGDTWVDVAAEVPVSMNLWGYTPGFLEALARDFPAFLRQEVPENPAKAEFYLPMEVAKLLEAGEARVRVLPTEDKWYGVTYAGDKPKVVAALAQMTREGKYPEGLF